VQLQFTRLFDLSKLLDFGKIADGLNLTGMMYIPVELLELAKGITWPRVTVFVINAFVVLYLLYMLLRRSNVKKTIDN
jgi:uncharacterized membrane protein (DUF2068 family)